jgi:hypothetical protein
MKLHGTAQEDLYLLGVVRDHQVRLTFQPARKLYDSQLPLGMHVVPLRARALWASHTETTATGSALGALRTMVG